MKYFGQIVPGKGLFVSIKGHFCLRKGHLANVEGQVEIKSTSSEVIFDKIKKTLFNKPSDLWMLYLSKTISDALLCFIMLYSLWSKQYALLFQIVIVTKLSLVL